MKWTTTHSCDTCSRCDFSAVLGHKNNNFFIFTFLLANLQTLPGRKRILSAALKVNRRLKLSVKLGHLELGHIVSCIVKQTRVVIGFCDSWSWCPLAFFCSSLSPSAAHSILCLPQGHFRAFCDLKDLPLCAWNFLIINVLFLLSQTRHPY